MEWTQVRMYISKQSIEVVSGYLISNGLKGIMIEDSEDFDHFLEEIAVNWSYIDDELMKMKECKTAIVFYIPDNMQGMEMLKAIKGGTDKLVEDNKEIDFGEIVFESEAIKEEDWETAWKKYYHPTRIGEHIVVCPCWEECDLGEGDVKVILDPGMAFGTGTHETTRLCMQLLEKHITPNTTMLDIGTGSGILATTALLLGSKTAVGVDIDELAVKIAKENASLNGVGERIELHCGDLTEKISGKYDVICANIVADVIIRLCQTITQFMHEGTMLLVSGIIDDRCDEVLEALRVAGLEIIETITENDWVAVGCKLVK